jgi:hypothetical protein
VGTSHPEIWKVQAEGGVIPPLPRNCEGNETHKKNSNQPSAFSDQRKHFFS